MLLADGWVHRNIDAIGLIAGIVTVVAFVAAIVIYFKQKQRKTLDYVINSSLNLVAPADSGIRLGIVWMGETELVSNEPVRRGQTEEVRYQIESGKGRVLDRPRQVDLTVKNTGRVPIDRADFQDPISLTTGSGLIIDIEVTAVSHPGILPLGPLPGVDGRMRQRRSRRPC